MRRWDTNLNAFVDVQMVRRYDTELNAFIDVQGAYISELGVRRQVWPTKLYLIKSGIPVTGYTTNSYMNSSSASDSWHSGKTPGVSRGSGSLDVTMSRQDSSHHGIGSVFFSQAINLSRYKRLVIRMAEPVSTKTSGSEAWLRVSVTDDIKNAYGLLASISLPSDGRESASVSIASLSGSFYIVLTVCAASTTSDTYTFKIADLWLEA